MSTNIEKNHALVLFYNRKHHPIIVQRLLDTGVKRVDTVIVNLGEIKEPDLITDEAKRSGSENVYYIDGKCNFSESYLSWLIKANAIYNEKYYLSAAIARPCLVDTTVALAREIGADILVHGYRGNDMIRMNVGYQSLEMDYIPALSKFKINDAELQKVSKDLMIPDEFGMCNPFSVSDNIWGRSIECGTLEDISIPAPKESYGKCRDVSGTDIKPETVHLGFAGGVPVWLNGKTQALHEIIESLNSICGSHGIGRYDLVEDGSVGFKTRAIYEHPAATCIIQAHKELERLVLNKHEADLKKYLDECFAKNIYAGLWFDPVMNYIKQTLEQMNQLVSGEVSLRLLSGTFEIERRASKNSLYQPNVSIYNYGHLFSENDADGYANTYNLHTSWTRKQRNKKI